MEFVFLLWFWREMEMEVEEVDERDGDRSIREEEKTVNWEWIFCRDLI